MLLDAQRQVLSCAREELEDVRSKAEERAIKISSRFLGSLLGEKKLLEFPVYCFESEVASLLGFRSAVTDLENFLPAVMREGVGFDVEVPGTARDVSELTENQSAFLLRFGFFESERDVYETVLLGYQGLTVFVRNLDLYQAQYFAEVGRDFKMSVILMVDSIAALETVLQTDAPYIGVWAYQEGTMQLNWDFVLRALESIPTACMPIVFGPNFTDAQKQMLRSLRCKGIVC